MHYSWLSVSKYHAVCCVDSWLVKWEGHEKKERMEEINNSGGFLYSWPRKWKRKGSPGALSLNLLGINYLLYSLFTILYLCNKQPALSEEKVSNSSSKFAGVKRKEGVSFTMLMLRRREKKKSPLVHLFLLTLKPDTPPPLPTRIWGGQFSNQPHFPPMSMNLWVFSWAEITSCLWASFFPPSILILFL